MINRRTVLSRLGWGSLAGLIASGATRARAQGAHASHDMPAVRQGAPDDNETFVYEFTLQQHGTHMYHPHADEMVQLAVGMMGLFIIHPKDGEPNRIDRDSAWPCCNQLSTIAHASLPGWQSAINA